MNDKECMELIRRKSKKQKKMNELIEIKCPDCGAVLTVRYFEGIETKMVSCPICRYRDLFANYINEEKKSGKNEGTDSIMSELSDEQFQTMNVLEIMHLIRPASVKPLEKFMQEPGFYAIADVERPYYINVRSFQKDNKLMDMTEDTDWLYSDKSENRDADKFNRMIKRVIHNPDFFFLCPVCGNVMRILKRPETLSNDWICECVNCKNRFSFGETHFSNLTKLKIEDFSSDPVSLALNALHYRNLMITKARNGFAIRVAINEGIIVRKSEEGVLLTDIVSLVKAK